MSLSFISIVLCCWLNSANDVAYPAFHKSRRATSEERTEQYFRRSQLVGSTKTALPMLDRGGKGRQIRPIMQSDSLRTIGRPSPSRDRRELARSIRPGNKLPSNNDCRSACRSSPLPENEVRLPPRRP